MIKKYQVTEWVSHPVTQKMLEILTEHKEANRTLINDSVVYGPSISQLDLHVISQIRGQILAFEEILNIKEYLMDSIEEEENNEISGIRPEDFNQG